LLQTVCQKQNIFPSGTKRRSENLLDFLSTILTNNKSAHLLHLFDPLTGFSIEEKR